MRIQTRPHTFTDFAVNTEPMPTTPEGWRKGSTELDFDAEIAAGNGMVVIVVNDAGDQQLQLWKGSDGEFTHSTTDVDSDKTESALVTYATRVWLQADSTAFGLLNAAAADIAFGALNVLHLETEPAPMFEVVGEFNVNVR